MGFLVLHSWLLILLLFGGQSSCDSIQVENELRQIVMNEIKTNPRIDKLISELNKPTSSPTLNPIDSLDDLQLFEQIQANQWIINLHSMLNDTQSFVHTIANQSSTLSNITLTICNENNSTSTVNQTIMDNLQSVSLQLKSSLPILQTKNKALESHLNISVTNHKAWSDVEGIKESELLLQGKISELRSFLGRMAKILVIISHLNAESMKDKSFIKWCLNDATEIASESEKINLQASNTQNSPDSFTIFLYVLSSLGIVLSLWLLFAPGRFNSFSNSMAAMYSFGLMGYAISYFWFSLYLMNIYVSDDAMAYMFATYGVALAGGLLGIISFLLAIFHSAFPWSTMGFSFGLVFGTQCNTLGLYLLQSNPAYFTYSLSAGVGAGLFMIIFIVLRYRFPLLEGRLFPFVRCWVGGYLLVKTIGTIVGSYPDELNLAFYSLDLNSATIGYPVGGMVIAIFVFLLQLRCFLPDPPTQISSSSAASSLKNNENGIDASMASGSSGSSSLKNNEAGASTAFLQKSISGSGYNSSNIQSPPSDTVLRNRQAYYKV